jgi:hypothetical protein
MAIFHLHAQLISRRQGQSVTAAAAYRSGEKIEDERTGLTFDYTRKQGVYATEILTPENAPAWMGDRGLLWNAVEQTEKRKDAQLARELDLALPIELNHEEKRQLLRAFVQRELVSRGMVADLAFHDFDSHNPHAHILLTTRTIEGDRFGNKERSWNSRELLVELRQSWEQHANKALKIADRDERIDSRTLAEQGSQRIPQIHLGPNVAAMMGKNLATERGDTYLAIQVANQEIDALESQITALEKTLAIEEQPTPERAKLWQATATITQLLRHFGQKTPAGWEFQGNKLYDYHADSDFQTVALYARDGRGLLLKQENGQVTGKLTASDFDNLQELDKRLQPEINRRAREVAQISLAALHLAGKQMPEKIARRGGWTRFEGHRYTYQVSDDGQTLEIKAKDGRGTILRQQGEQIESQLTGDDINRFKQIQPVIQPILPEKGEKQARESPELEY